MNAKWICHKIGSLYFHISQFNDALHYFKKQLNTCQKTGDFAGEGTSYNNIGNVYNSLGQYEKAMEYHMKHLSI